jgi:hypothetical protein
LTSTVSKKFGPMIMIPHEIPLGIPNKWNPSHHALNHMNLTGLGIIFLSNYVESTSLSFSVDRFLYI